MVNKNGLVKTKATRPLLENPDMLEVIGFALNKG